MLEIRTITEDEIVGFRDAMFTTFGDDPVDDPTGEERFRATIDRSRAWAAFDNGLIVGTTATYDLVVNIPGGTLPMAGLTGVSVRPTHRRRGIMRELIGRHVNDARIRGVPISGLWASEAAIYGRFGYGIAIESDALEIDSRGLQLAAGRDLDPCEWIDEARARELLPAIYARAILDRPGSLHRSDPWWRERRFLEAPFMRRGASRRRHVIVSRAGDLVGYVVYRQRAAHGDTPGGQTEIIELLAVDPQAEASLWSFIVGIDLFPTATWWNAPVDCTLPWLVGDPRRIKRSRSDTLWIRIDDVAATLAARSYPTDGTLIIGVDEISWQLVVEGGAAICSPTAMAPQLRCTRAALGSMFLGGVQPSLLARATQIHGDPAAIALADRMFAWPIAPWCPEVF